ncbi:MAG: laminin G [Marivirga sp.]|nr:laminin G [Marivirga sp.]
MPNLPSPYIMRDWNQVALKYDALVFSTTAVGQYLPLIHIKPNGLNYPELQPILMDTYVGSESAGNQAESINIIPALVGSTLVGIDKSSQNGINWVLKAKEFFNKANSQNIYLNGYSSTSGTDWWYDLMSNVFFYQLYSLYPDIADFDLQFTTIGDQWLAAVHAMGGSTTPWNVPEMNYRAWRLSSMTPNNTGVIEPEAAGAIAWLLYHAWLKTGEKKYLTGAQLAMDFLSNLTSNPSYELQLPYGAFVAAKMNAELGTHYDIEKIVNWCFDRGSLRGWGVITGKWNGSDVSGLIGEANDAGNDYAFAMNGFQQAAALVPMVKYDKRFARDIAKWMLNLANASRLYYAQFLPSTSQDDYDWSTLYDPESLIAYEALKENLDGKKLYGTGDAKREGWGETNLGVYGSSQAGYLGAIVESTDVEGVLQLDINKTDFFGENPFPSFLVYNPHEGMKAVTLATGPGSFDIYDAISETIIKSGVNGNVSFNVSAHEVMMLTYLPAGSALVAKDGKLHLGNDIVDYHYGNIFEGKLRIKSLDVQSALVEFNQEVPVYSTIENATGIVTYTWYVNDILLSTSTSQEFSWTVPETEGSYKVLLEIASGVFVAKDSINLNVLENIPVTPVITGFTMDATWYLKGTQASIVCQASNISESHLTYKWTLPEGMLLSQDDSLIHWVLPQTEGLYQIQCEVTNDDNLTATSFVNVLVKNTADGTTPPAAYYPLDGDVLDYSGNEHHGTLEGAQSAVDSRGEPDKAYKFSSGSDIIFVTNKSVLNFQDEITISFWVKLDAVTQESFILSHGSWEERLKISVTPDHKLRWTIKTTAGTKDLDSSFPLQLNHYYHFAVVYSGYTVELYVDGHLDAFLPHNGAISATGKAITFGRKDLSVTNYSLRGSIDEVRIYDEALEPDEISTLNSLWNITTDVVPETNTDLIIYPNPSNGLINIVSVYEIKKIQMWDLLGNEIPITWAHTENSSHFDARFSPKAGIYIIKLETPVSLVYQKLRVD